MSTDDPDIIKKFETEMEDENEANKKYKTEKKIPLIDYL